MFKCEGHEHVIITDILDNRCNNIMILSKVIDICMLDCCNMKPDDIIYINELLRNEIKLLREELTFDDVI